MEIITDKTMDRVMAIQMVIITELTMEIIMEKILVQTLAP